jgi:ABC-type dipeptide/oligopeptide/nickel transport system, ATPase component
MPRSSGNGSVVSAKDLSIRYRTRDSRSHMLAVDGVSFELQHRETLAVTGESGAGKSTLAAAVALGAGHGTRDRGYPEICGGSLTVLGAKARRMSSYRRNRLVGRVGYLAQGGAEALKPFLTVGENVAEPVFARDRRFSPAEAASLVATIVDAVHLPLGVIPKLPHELSQGHRQRVALARALILRPPLLVADAPTSGLDPTVREGVLDVLRELQGDWGFAALVVSNDPGISRFTQRVAVMRHGIIVGIGSIAELRSGPCAAYLPEAD